MVTSRGWSHTPISPVKPSISWTLFHPCPPSEMVQPIPPHPPSVCHSRSLSLGFAPPTHTLCKCQSSETEREREESRRLCLLRKLSTASSASLLKQGVCVCALTDTRSLIWVAERESKKGFVLREDCVWRRKERWKKNILFLLYRFLTSTACG